MATLLYQPSGVRQFGNFVCQQTRAASQSGRVRQTIMHRVGFSVCPANARPEVKQVANLVTQGGGGNGVLREVAELILRAQGHWDEILKSTK